MTTLVAVTTNPQSALWLQSRVGLANDPRAQGKTGGTIQDEIRRLLHKAGDIIAILDLMLDEPLPAIDEQARQHAVDDWGHRIGSGCECTELRAVASSAGISLAGLRRQPRAAKHPDPDIGRMLDTKPVDFRNY